MADRAPSRASSSVVDSKRATHLITAKAPTQFDPCLPLQSEATEAHAEQLLEQLMCEQAEPVIREIVGARLRIYSGSFAAEGEYEDVCSEVRVQLLMRLAALSANPAEQAIRDFRAYVAVTAYRACAAYLRRKYPQRFQLKHKLRFLLSHRTEFAVWEKDAGILIGGLAVWRNQPLAPSAQSRERLENLRKDPRRCAQTALPRKAAAGVPLAELVAALFHWVGQPLELDELTGTVAELWGVRDHSAWRVDAKGGTQAREAALALIPDERENLAQTIEHRFYLEKLWQEINQLTLQHRAALLLNLKDEQGRSATELFIFTGIISVSQLAAALSLTEEALAQLWHQLPLADLLIAERLGLTRQQVINLRKTARERLTRRMRECGF